MPILHPEPDIYPAELLDSQAARDQSWWAMYTMARQEKKLMRYLVDHRIGFYAPVITRRYRSPNGRLRMSTQPLFANYVFVNGDELQRYAAVSSGTVSRCCVVSNVQELLVDLKQIRQLIQQEAPLSPESKLVPGQRVRIRNGSFAGYEGVIFRREQEIRLQVVIRFMNQGVSVLLDDCQVDEI